MALRDTHTRSFMEMLWDYVSCSCTHKIHKQHIHKTLRLIFVSNICVWVFLLLLLICNLYYILTQINLYANHNVKDFFVLVEVRDKWWYTLGTNRMQILNRIRTIDDTEANMLRVRIYYQQLCLHALLLTSSLYVAKLSIYFSAKRNKLAESFTSNCSLHQ